MIIGLTPVNIKDSPILAQVAHKKKPPFLRAVVLSGRVVDVKRPLIALYWLGID